MSLKSLQGRFYVVSYEKGKNVVKNTTRKKCKLTEIKVGYKPSYNSYHIPHEVAIPKITLQNCVGANAHNYFYLYIDKNLEHKKMLQNSLVTIKSVSETQISREQNTKNIIPKDKWNL